MRITVNGQDFAVPAGTTIAELLVQLDIAQTAVAVELNLEVQPKTAFTERTLHPDDRVEIVTLVGGG
ncbi:MAG: sulfur carrier protein ThiS [Mariniblastus sp.]|nr:sulfur carrier protein ThiS [Mariniblastus sp.]